MKSNVELRTAALKSTIEVFESERDKLLDQVAHLKGHSDRLEWVIRVLLAQVARIEQEEMEQAKKQEEEKQKQQIDTELAAQHEAALALARQAGNVGVHPSERKAKLSNRKKSQTQASAEE